jgi:6-phosphofructokinase 1
MDNESMRRVHIVEAMGRDAGWLTAASVLGRQGRGDPPHLVYPPEKAFEQDKFLRGVEEVYSRLGHAEVVVSEGIRNVEGDLLAASHTLDSFGHPHLGGVAERLASLVQAELKVAARFDVLGTLQRSFMPCVSRTDRKEAFEVGKRAVREALKGAAGKMVTLVRKSSDPYVCETGLADLEKVAFRTRPLEERYILDAGADIAPSFVNYVEPLAEGAKFTSSVPRFYRLKGHPVKKRLRPYQES